MSAPLTPASPGSTCTRGLLVSLATTRRAPRTPPIVDSTVVELPLDIFTTVEQPEIARANQPHHSTLSPFCSMSKPDIELTQAEWAIIKAVWEIEPCDAPAVQERLHPITRWTYSTVRTLMDRMAAKGLLTAAKLGNATIYRSAITRDQAQRGELLYALKHAFNGALTPMVQCLLETGSLSVEELAALEKMVRERRRKAARRRP